jgi:hypothetical protein
MSNYLEKALRAWWRTAWVTLEAFQKRYVESGYKDSSSWPNNILFQSYEWAVVNRVAQEDARLRSRLLEPVVTALGATTTMSLEAVGREFLDQAWHRIKTGKLLVGDPDDTFSQIYAVIEPWIRAEKALPYEALTLLYNVRVEGQIALDERVTLRQLHGDEKAHQRWNDTTWDDVWELPAVVAQRIDLPILAPGITGDSASAVEAFRSGARDVLLTLALLGPTRATLGKMSLSAADWAPNLGFMSFVLDYPYGLERLTVPQAHAPLLQAAWRAIRQDRALRIASEYLADPRRFADPEKALIDVVTSIEALAGQDSKRRLQRRMCLYCARLVSMDLGLSQRQVFDGLMAAFARREKALRGREPSAEERAGGTAILSLAQTVARRLLQMRIVGDERLRRDVIDILLD